MSIEDVVVFDNVLADIEVVRFDLLLCVFDRTRDPRMFERNVFFEAEPIHQTGDGSSAKTPHQFIFERDEKPRRARITLTARATAELVVDAARLVTFGAEHM